MQLNVHIDYSRNLSLLLFVFMGVFLGVFFGGKLRKKKKKKVQNILQVAHLFPPKFSCRILLFLYSIKKDK